MIYTGIDCSFNSPSVVVNENEKTRILFFTDKKKKYNKFYYNENNLQINCIQYEKTDNRFTQIDYITKHIMNFIPSNSLIGIEEYSFGSWSRGLSKIHEMSGILQYLLYKKGYNIKEINIKQNKRMFSGSGNSSKYAMIANFNSDLNVVLNDILLFKKGFDGSPVSDIADAYAIMCALKGKEVNKANVGMNILDDLLQEN